MPKTKAKNGGAAARLLPVILALAVVGSTAYAVHRQYERELDAEYESLANSMYAVRNLINFEDSLQASYESFDLREAILFTDVAKLYFDYNGVSEQTLSDYAYKMKDCAIYYFRNDGSAVLSDNADELPLEKNQMRILKTIGALETDDYDYTAVRLDDGWLYIQWEDATNLYEVDFQRILESCPNELCVIENATGRVLAFSSREVYDFLDESRIAFDKQREGHRANGIQAGFFDGGSLFSGAYFEKIRLLNRYSVFACVPLRSVLADAMRKTAPEFGLMFLCFLFIWLCARRMREQGAAVQNPNRFLRLGKRCYVDFSVLRHVASLLLAGIALTAAATAYLPLLSVYTDHNAKMENNLGSFVNEMQLSDEEWEKMEAVFRNLVTDRVSTIADFMEMMGGDFDAEVLSDLTKRMDFISAVVYNEDGVAEMSTDGYIGYALSQNPDDDEHILWNLLNHADVSLMGEFSDKSGFFAAVRRTDAPGLVYATLTDNALRAMKEQTDTSTALLRVNTDTYAKIYVSAEEPETLLWATSSASKVRSLPNNLPENALRSRYSGTQTMNGYPYYLNTVTDGEHIIISAERNEVFAETARGILGWIIPQALLIALLILYAACLYRWEGEWPEEETEKGFLARLFSGDKETSTEEEQQLNASLKHDFARLAWLFLMAMVVLYLADTLFSAHPVSSYLFSRQGEREVGIFAMTTILVSVAFAVLGVTLLKKVFDALSGKMDSRIKTIGNLLTSIAQFAVSAVVAIYSLYQLGVNTSIILTSAGVLSLIIGYGSQSIVGDLVSGIFLIMEDQIRIGETLYIDGFRGKVTHIGLRTTTVQRYNNVKVINNSKMAGFYNVSRSTASVRWTLSFYISQDMKQVEELIMSNGERFQKACKGNIIRGPIFMGVSEGETDCGANTFYSMKFMFITNIDKWHSVRKRSFTEAYRILLENGIKPAGGARENIV